MNLACATGCTQQGRHLSDCPCADPQHEHDAESDGYCTCGLAADEQDPGCVRHKALCPRCTGCLPRLAAPGLAVCPTCERRTREALAELPDLWVDLAERPRLAGISNAPEGEGETPLPLGDDRWLNRDAIWLNLVNWCRTLEEEGAAHLPVEADIAATTRRIASWESDQAHRCRDAAFLASQPHWDPSLGRDVPPDPAAVTRLKDDEHRHGKAAQTARDDRETGRDVVRAVCEHIARHLERLLASDEHAEQLVHDMTKTAKDARGKAYPTRPERLTVPCPSCGTRNRATLDPAGDIRCKHCGDKGDSRWWGANAEHEPMNLKDLRDYLGTEGLYPTERQLRSWADKGKLETTRPGRGPDGKMQDRLFDPLKSIHVVAGLLGHKRHERRVA